MTPNDKTLKQTMLRIASILVITPIITAVMYAALTLGILLPNHLTKHLTKQAAKYEITTVNEQIVSGFSFHRPTHTISFTFNDSKVFLLGAKSNAFTVHTDSNAAHDTLRIRTVASVKAPDKTKRTEYQLFLTNESIKPFYKGYTETFQQNVPTIEP